MAAGSTAVYQVITDRIIGLLDRGVVPWLRPWRTSAGATTSPTNILGRQYRGINQLFLSAVAMAEGYSSPVWLTFKQCNAQGGKVRAGMKGYPVVFWKQLDVEEQKDTGERVTKKVPMLRYFTVFNLDQTEGVKLPAKVAELVEGDDFVAGDFDPIAAAEAIVAGMPNPPTIVERPSNKAFYSPASDIVTVPERTQFEQSTGYYSTLFHELVHSTGHESRLARRGSSEVSHQFGDAPYAKEELVAEMGNAFLSAVAGIDPATVSNSAAYIASWKKVLQDDPKVVVTAAGQAQKAADYILGIVAETKKED